MPETHRVSDAVVDAGRAADAVLEFERIYRRHWRSIVGYFRRRVSAVDAEELAQETFFKAHRGHERFRGDASEATWLLVIAKHVYANHLRRYKTKKREGYEISIDQDAYGSDEEPRELPSHDPDALDARLEDERDALLRKAMGSLPPRTSEIMRLAFVDGLKYREIADRLEIRENTVKSSVFQGKRKLKSFILQRAPELSVDLGDGG